MWLKKGSLIGFIGGLLLMCTPVMLPGSPPPSGTPPKAAQTKEAVPPTGPKKDQVELGVKSEGKTVQKGKKDLSSAVEKMLNGTDQPEGRFQISFPGDVMFDSGKWEIKPTAERLLRKFLKTVKNLKIKEILIEGHTDSVGSRAYNLELSKRRAEAVKDWLIEKGGLRGVKIVTKGYGESKPIAPNTNPDGSDNPKGRAKNRRVEVFVTLAGE